MATAATIAGWTITADAVAIEEVLSVSGLGKTNDTIEVTNFDSPAGTKEYIAGLADGAEITVECNYIAAGAGQLAARASVDAGSNVAIVMTYAATTEIFTFQAAAQGWSISPSTSDQNRCEFVFKISGDITVT